MPLSRNTPNATRPLRRSSRLNGTESQTVDSDGQRQTKRRKPNDDDDTLCLPTRRDNTTPLASTSTDSKEFARRERALSKRERELRRKSDVLDKRLSDVGKKEKECMDATLILLEESFQCAMCQDILACPYVLIPGQCGHTFCALCTLNWFFSRLHRACGSWHESVDCPICRSLLIYTPDATPRPILTFPFAPNRVVDGVIRALVDKLSPAKGASGTCRLKQWAEGGALREEWLKRDQLGRAEMKYLSDNWRTLESVDFVNIKNRLGV